MQNDSKIAGKNKIQITRFANRISHGFQKTSRKFLVQMLYGIQASKDVNLSNISRSLNEQIPLIKTETRLSRNMGKQDLTERINGNLVADGATRVSHDTVIALDLSDLDKPYAKKMEHLALVRDGSTGEPRSSGYWLLEVLGADVEGEDLMPLYGKLYSKEARGFRSENSQILAAVDRVRERVEDRGIWAMDRFIVGNDMASGTGVISLGILRILNLISSLGRISGPEAIAMATGNTVRCYKLNRGLIKEGCEADLIMMGTPWALLVKMLRAPLRPVIFQV